MDPRRRRPGAGSAATSSMARPLEASSQPGTRSRSTPATSAAASTSGRSSANCGDWRWAWVSTRRTGPRAISGPAGIGAGARSRAAGRAGWGRPASRARRRGRPRPARRGAAARPPRRASHGYVVAELGEDARRGARHDRRGREGDQAARLQEVAQDVAQPRGGRLVAGLRRLREDPRRLGVDGLVRPADELPELGQRLVDPAAVELLRRPAGACRPSPRQRRVAGRSRRRSLAAEVAVGHRDRPVDEVAEVVGQVGVVAAQEAVPRDVGVAVEGDLAEGHVAGAVGAERGHEVERVEEVAPALAHPLALGQEPAVDPDLARRLEPGRPEHRRPEDRVEAGDVLADHVQVGRPPALEGSGSSGKPAPVM